MVVAYNYIKFLVVKKVLHKFSACSTNHKLCTGHDIIVPITCCTMKDEIIATAHC